MAFVGAIFDLAQGAVPVCRVTRELLDGGSYPEFRLRILDVDLFERAHDADGVHAELRGLFFLDAGEVLFEADAEGL